MLVFFAALGLTGCVAKPTTQDTQTTTRDEVKLNTDELKLQDLSDQDDIETLEMEVDSTVFVDEDLSNLE